MADLPYYTEGPAADAQGNIFFTTLTGGTILKLDNTGHVSEWAESECPNGQIILPGGDHLVCDSQLGVLKRFDWRGKFVRNETENYISDEQVYAPNDLVADDNGNIFYTDSIRHKGKICMVQKDGTQHIVAGELDYPNGIVLSRLHHCLYVAESYRNRILKLNLNENGFVNGSQTVFAELPAHDSKSETDNLPDGLALDEHGNLWVAHYGMQALQVLTPDSELIFTINTRLPLTSNVFLTGKNSAIVTGGYGEPGPGAVMKIDF